MLDPRCETLMLSEDATNLIDVKIYPDCQCPVLGGSSQAQLCGPGKCPWDGSPSISRGGEAHHCEIPHLYLN